MGDTTQFSNSQMLEWMGYIAKMEDVTPEKIKILNTCGKRRNVLATIATHKRILIFADETHDNLLYKCWEAGYGDYEMYYGTGYEPSEMKHCKVSDMMDDPISGPTVLFIVNENTRESMIFGMKNENFSNGTVKYVGHEIRAVIMNKLELDVRDVALLVNSESVAIEASMIAYEGVIVAYERDEGSKRTMEENIDKFGVHNIEVITDLEEDTLKELPIPRLAFIVATKESIDNDIESLLKVNPDIKFIFYTLELDILTDVKTAMEKHGIKVTEVMQITVAKTDKHSVFEAQPAPWMITGEPMQK
ncbi:MAG: Precorrin-6B methylase 2 [Eubacterium sp.]|nr:Precorrin-6B methylase 2 [Eubacterium sp.]